MTNQDHAPKAKIFLHFLSGLFVLLVALPGIAQTDPYMKEALEFYKCAEIGRELKGEDRKAAGMACLRALYGPTREEILRYKLEEAQKLERWDSAWETALPRDPEARAIAESHCKKDAKETIFSTAIEYVSSFFLEVENGHAFEDIRIETDSLGGGMGYSKIWYRFPQVVEADADRFGDPKRNSDKLPVVAFVNTQPVYRKARESQIVVAFRRATTPEEESKGVYGRTISVTNSATKQLLGERTEYFWLSRPNFRDGVRDRFAICPMVGVKEGTPGLFISKIINPGITPCLLESQEEHIRLERSRRIEFLKNIAAGSAESSNRFSKYRKWEFDIDQKLRLCVQAYKAHVPKD